MKSRPENEQKEVVARILKGHSSGLTFTVRELHEMIQEELAKTDREVDNELVDQCSKLLCEMYHCGSEDVDIAKERSKLQLLHKIANQKKAKHFFLPWCRCTVRVAIMTITLLLIVGLADILLNPYSVLRVQSPDGGDYIIQGANQDNVLIPSSIADIGEREPKDITATNMKMVFEELGYEFSLPSLMPEEVAFSKANISVDSTSDRVTLRYKSESNKQIIIAVVRLYSARGTSAYYEQNEPGKIVELPNGDTAYIAQNVDVPWGLYETEDLTYQISCVGYNEETLVKIINSIGEKCK